jgi:hypothetical protein
MGPLPHGFPVPAKPDPAPCLEGIAKTDGEAARLSGIMKIGDTV